MLGLQYPLAHKTIDPIGARPPSGGSTLGLTVGIESTLVGKFKVMVSMGFPSLAYQTNESGRIIRYAQRSLIRQTGECTLSHQP